MFLSRARVSQMGIVNARQPLEFPARLIGTGRPPTCSHQIEMDFVMANTSRPTSRSPTRRKATKSRATTRKTRRKTPKRWSQRVSRESDALDLRRGLFTLRDPKRIAASLKRSAEHSSRRKAGAYRSAVSMLTFYINRAGKTLPKTQRARLERAKFELKRQFGRD